MSVAAMTMDDQRPLINSYDKMPKQFDQNIQSAGFVAGASLSGPASPTPSGSEEPATSQHHHYESQTQQQQPQQQHHHHHSGFHHHHQQHHHHHHHSSSHHHHHSHQTPQSEQQQQPPLALTLPSVPLPLQSHPHSQQQQQQQQQSTQPQQQQVLAPIVADAVAAVEQRRLLEEEIESLKVEHARLAQQCADAQRREKILMRRLANKEQEFQDYVSQIAEYKAAQAPNALALRSALLDPAVNLLFEKLKKELKATKAKLEETQNELSAWKFTPDSNTGKRLMAKCRLLYQENEELGKMTSNGRLAKLETELAMQKAFSEEVKKSQSELDDFLQELDEDVEGMQSTILFLQQELKITRDRIQTLEKENCQLKNGVVDDGVKDEVDEDTQSRSSPHSGLNGNGNVHDHAISYQSQKQSPSLQTAEPQSSALLQHPQQQHQLQPISLTNAINELKYQPIMETIDETVCVRNYVAPSSEFYNGTDAINVSASVPVPVSVSTVAPPPASAAPVSVPVPVPVTIHNTAPIVIIDDGSSSGGSSNGTAPCGPLKFRTAASRKRNFDCDNNEANAAQVTTSVSALPVATAVVTNTLTPIPPVVTHVPQVSVPRCTLPPKKSKLRVTSPVRQLPMAAVDLTADSIDVSTPQVLNLTAQSMHSMENAVVADESSVLLPMAVDDMGNGNNGNASNGNSNNNLAQRIMTRRRSIRTQNGSGGNDSN